MQIGNVLIRQARPSVASFLKTALKLGEEPEATPKVPVCMKKIALQEVAGSGFEVGAEAGVFVVFVFIANLSADGEKPILVSERNILDIVEQFLFAFCVREQAPVLIVTKRLQNGALFLARRRC